MEPQEGTTPSLISPGCDADGCKETGDAPQAEEEKSDEEESSLQLVRRTLTEKHVTADERLSEVVLHELPRIRSVSLTDSTDTTFPSRKFSSNKEQSIPLESIFSFTGYPESPVNVDHASHTDKPIQPVYPYKVTQPEADPVSAPFNRNNHDPGPSRKQGLGYFPSSTERRVQTEESERLKDKSGHVPNPPPSLPRVISRPLFQAQTEHNNEARGKLEKKGSQVSQVTKPIQPVYPYKVTQPEADPVSAPFNRNNHDPGPSRKQGLGYFPSSTERRVQTEESERLKDKSGHVPNPPPSLPRVISRPLFQAQTEHNNEARGKLEKKGSQVSQVTKPIQPVYPYKVTQPEADPVSAAFNRNSHDPGPSHEIDLVYFPCPTETLDLLDPCQPAALTENECSRLENLAPTAGALQGDNQDNTSEMEGSAKTFNVSGCSQYIAPAVCGPPCLQARTQDIPSLNKTSASKHKNLIQPMSLLDTSTTTSQEFTPVITVDETFRFQCFWPGRYQCSITGLVFHMEGNGDVVYRTAPWSRSLLAQHHQQPAGPLFDITCPQQSVRQLHLPHCEISSTRGCDFLSVAHVNDDNIEFIVPHKITETHVIINITGFSNIGIVKDENSPPDPVPALVLLFYKTPADPDSTSVLNVLLLPKNVMLRDVVRTRKKLVGDETYIETSPHCKLQPNQEYTLSTCPEDDSVLVQPNEAEFCCDNYHNYFPSFQVELEKVMKYIKLFLRGTNSPLTHSVWERRVCLSPTGLNRSCGLSTLNLPPNKRLRDIWSCFVDGISGPVLTSLLDKLFEKRVMNEAEWESAQEMQNRRDKARFVIDTVRRKGKAASSVMIEFLCETDPFLSKHLGLI